MKYQNMEMPAFKKRHLPLFKGWDILEFLTLFMLERCKTGSFCFREYFVSYPIATLDSSVIFLSLVFKSIILLSGLLNALLN